MFTLLVLAEAFTGIVLMTFFSYLVTKVFKDFYIEPGLLNFLFVQTGIDVLHDKRAGWIVHYAIGVLFVVAYQVIWNTTPIDPTWQTAFWFGVISGLIGIGGWTMMFSLARQKPKINFLGYFAHLLVAHIVFVAGVVLTERFFMDAFR